MKIECTLKDLYDFNKINGSVDNGNFKVDTQYGFHEILGVDITAKNSRKIKVCTNKQKNITVAPDHMLFRDNKWVKTSKLSLGHKIKTRSGYEKISRIENLGDIEDLYDIQVNNVNEFYANDIVSHNSFLVNLPKILYYGKLDKFKKEDIANRLNKHAWIWGETEIRPGEYTDITRNFAPSNLIVSKGNQNEEKEDIGKSGISNYQDYIDTEITGLPYHIFSNIISLSVNDFKSFISMSPSDKRIIVDKLFSMEIINQMNELVRKDLRDAKINIDIYDREIKSLDDTIKSANRELEKLKERVKNDNTKKIGDIIKKMGIYKPKLLEAHENLKNWKNKKIEIEKAYNIFYRKSGQIEAEIKNLNKRINLFHQDKCPTCETPFSESRFDLIRENVEGKLKAKKEELEDLKFNEKKYRIAHDKTNEAIKKLNDFILQVNSTYTSLDIELNKLKIDKPKEFESIRNIISKNTCKIQNKETNKISEDSKFKHLLILEELYSDKGVKKKILESFLPTLNREVEYTLSELHFPYRLRFTNDFDPIMNHLGMEVNVETLSTGEKKRVDLAVLISIIRMIKRKYPTLNIFMLDEVLSSIDGDGIYDIIGLLRKTSKELNLNIFIINHSPLPLEYFDYKIEIDKNDGFSDLKIEKLETDESIESLEIIQSNT